MILIKPILESFRWEDIPDEEYFSEKYSDCISNSRLSLINPDQGGSPEKYIANEHKVSDSFLLGSAVHAEILQPGEFNIIGGVNRPTAKLGLMADELFDCYPHMTPDDIVEASNKINYYKGKMDDKKCQFVYDNCLSYWKCRVEQYSDVPNAMFLDDNTMNKYQACITSVQNNTQIQALLEPDGIFEDPEIGNEVAFFIIFLATDTETGQCVELPFKAKLDNYTIVDGVVTLNDLKTTGHWLSKFPDSFEQYHYYRQMGAYSWLLKLYAEKKKVNIESFNANMLLVSTVPDYYSGVFRVKASDIQRGFNEFKYLLKLVAKLKMQ